MVPRDKPGTDEKIVSKAVLGSGGGAGRTREARGVTRGVVTAVGTAHGDDIGENREVKLHMHKKA